MTLTTQSAHRKDVHTAKHGVALEHRHFSFIAAVLADIEDDGIRQHMVGRFADACARTNPRFDRARFLKACKQ